MPKAGSTNSDKTVKEIDRVIKIRILARSNSPIPLNFFIVNLPYASVLLLVNDDVQIYDIEMSYGGFSSPGTTNMMILQ
jgi:hypothetical protein